MRTGFWLLVNPSQEARIKFWFFLFWAIGQRKQGGNKGRFTKIHPNTKGNILIRPSSHFPNWSNPILFLSNFFYLA